MKVLVVGMSPLPWEIHRELSMKYVLVSSSLKSFSQNQAEIAEIELVLIWAKRLSKLKLSKTVQYFVERFPKVKIVAAGCECSSAQRAELLKLGLTDCIPKRASTSELLAKIELASRQMPLFDPTPNFTHHHFSFNFHTQIASFHQVPIPLNRKETLILDTLLRHTGKIVSKRTLYHSSWENNEKPSSNSLEVYISSLRRKIEKPFDLQLIKTVKGRGYQVVTYKKEAENDKDASKKDQ